MDWKKCGSGERLKRGEGGETGGEVELGRVQEKIKVSIEYNIISFLRHSTEIISMSCVIQWLVSFDLPKVFQTICVSKAFIFWFGKSCLCVDRNRPDKRVLRLIERLGTDENPYPKRVLVLNKVDIIENKKQLLPLAQQFEKLPGYEW